MLARGSWDFIFLEMGKIFGIRKKIISIFSLLGFSPSPSFNNSGKRGLMVWKGIFCKKEVLD
jgi:hypothetical protein